MERQRWIPMASFLTDWHARAIAIGGWHEARIVHPENPDAWVQLVAGDEDWEAMCAARVPLLEGSAGQAAYDVFVEAANELEGVYLDLQDDPRTLDIRGGLLPVMTLLAIALDAIELRPDEAETQALNALACLTPSP